jgi:hypothetical protein
MPHSFGRSRLGFALMLLASLAITAAGCTKPAQEAPPAAGAQPALTEQPAAAPGGPAAAAPNQPAASAPTGRGAASGQPAAGAPAGTAAPASAPAAAAPPPPPPPPPPRRYTLAEGAVLTVKTISTLSTDAQAAGNTFRATLAEAIVEGDWVVAKKGADVEGIVVAATKGGRVKGTAQLEVAITGLTLSDGQFVRLDTSMAAAAAKSEKKKDVGKVAITTGAGAIIGAIAGGGKGAAIGAAVGGAGGTAAVMGTRGGPAVIPAGSELHFKVKTPVEITEKK